MPDEGTDLHLLSRRAVLTGMAGAAATLLPGCGAKDKLEARPEGPPETTTIRMNITPISCFAVQALAVDFLKGEGFTDVQLLRFPFGEPFSKLAAGELDIHMYPAQLAALRVDAGEPITMLGGLHVGCWQVFGNDSIKSLGDFRGKTLATGGPAAPDHALLAATLASVGIDIRTDVRVLNLPPSETVPRFESGELDGVWALPPFSYQLRDKKIGHVVLDSMMDRPWSQYYCCMATVNNSFMAANPIATRRALRAFLKATDVVAVDPGRGVQRMVELGYLDQAVFDAAVEDLRMVPFNVWRQYEPADTLNFYSLRLKDAGLVKGTPEQVISRGTDFRAFRELRRELKAN